MLYQKLRSFLEAVLEEDRAQDLIEYTLLLGFLALVSASLMLQSGNGLQGIWMSASSTIAVANPSGSDTTPTPTPPPGGGGGGDNSHQGDH